MIPVPRVNPRLVLLFVVGALILGAGTPAVADEGRLRPCFGLRHEPSYEHGTLYLAPLQAELYGRETSEVAASATSWVLGLEVYPEKGLGEGMTPFLQAGILMGQNSERGVITTEDSSYRLESSLVTREKGLYLGVGVRRSAWKAAFTFHFHDLDIRRASWTTIDGSPYEDNGWRTEVRSRSVGRYLLAPSLSYTLLDLLELKVEGWYEIIRSHPDVAGGHSQSEDLGPPYTVYPHEENNTDDFSYALQVSLDLLGLVDLF